MDIKNILLIIVGVANIIWGICVIFLGKEKKTSKSFSLIIFSVVFWTISMAICRMVDDVYLFLWTKIVYVAALCIPITFLFFAYKNKSDQKIFIIKKILIIVPWAILVIITFLTDYVIKNTHPAINKIFIIDFGWFYLFYQIYILGYFIWALIILFQAYKKNVGITKIRLLYIFWGSLISIIIGCISNLILLTFGYFKLNWFGQVATIFWFAIITYSMIKYRFFDIRIAFKRILTYLFTAIFIYLSFYLFFLLQKRYLADIYSFGSIIAGIIFAVFFTIALVFIQNWIKKSIQEHIYEDVYYSHEIIKGVGNELSKMVDLDKIINLTANTLKRNLNLEKIAIMLKSDRFINENEFVIVENQKFDKEKLLEFTKENILSFIQNANIIIRDELKEFNKSSHIELKIIDPLTRLMKEQQVQIILPLNESGKLLGFIFLGEKQYNNSYTKEDLEILESISEQYSIAIKNALIYKQAILVSEVMKKD